MPKTVLSNKVGSWAFIAGIAVAILAGIFIDITETVWLLTLLIALGLVVGLLNITAKEVVSFLVAAIALLVSTVSINAVLKLIIEKTSSTIVLALQSILGNIAVFVAPAAIIVALKAIFVLAEE
jgi:hypothetical protein